MKALKLNFQMTIGVSSNLIAYIAMITYYFTLAPTLSWGDSSDFAQRLAVGDRNWDGTPRDYDMYDFALSLFRHLPVGTLETRANFASAFLGQLLWD